MEQKSRKLVICGMPSLNIEIARAIAEEVSYEFKFPDVLALEVCFSTVVNGRRRTKGHRAPLAKHDEGPWQSRQDRKRLIKDKRNKR